MPLAGFTSFQGSKTTRKIMRVNNFAIFCELDRALTPVAPRARFFFCRSLGVASFGVELREANCRVDALQRRGDKQFCCQQRFAEMKSVLMGK